ncbi:MAG: hypothetical protein BZ135_05385 [Methanosphaera sp. rholeuAM6]|nr:MAG: hypothetical protein BZ135_05385 [Methanosphaera sp. rholeuAM6]
MDKKIILSVLIVALIGIVAATYQINTGDILNPLASVETEESPVTEVFTAPETQDDAQAKAEADAQAKAQAEAEAQAKAQAEADAQAQAQADAQAEQDNSASQSTAAGTTQKSSSLIGSGDTITVEGSGSNTEEQSSGNTVDTSDNTANTGTSDNTANTGTSDNNANTDTNPTPASSISDDIKSKIQSIIQPKIDSDQLILDMDSCTFANNEYQIKAYNQQHEFAGTFYVNIDTNEWHYIDKEGNYYTEETPTPGDPSNGALDTSQ